MLDHLLLSMPRRRLLAGLAGLVAAATNGVTASVVGRASLVSAQESKSRAVVPSCASAALLNDAEAIAGASDVLATNVSAFLGIHKR